jgi:hypothetical protein
VGLFYFALIQGRDFMLRTCQACGKEFDSKNKRKYCPSCSNREEVCIVCGKTFTTERFDQTRCKKCVGKAPRKPSKAGEVKCAMCGTVFMTKNAQTAKYCPECREKSHYQKKKAKVNDVVSDNQKMVQVRCAHCKEVFPCTWQQYRRGRKYCGTDCRDDAKRKRTKEKYGPTPVEEKIEQEVILDYEPHPGQLLFHQSKARFRVLNAANRWGKDRASINEFIQKFADMLSENRPSTLVPRVMGWIVAPTYQLARQNWMELKHFFPEQWVVGRPNEAERQMKTIYDGLIEVKSADDPESLVSVGLDIVLMTEVARAKNLQDIWANIFARLSSAGRGLNGEGGLGLFNSTPVGRNFFHTMYMWGQDPTMKDWESWQFDCYSSPYITARDIEIAKKTLPERLFRQNWLAEFLSDGGEVFANVDELSIGQIEDPQPGRLYKAAWDPAQRGDTSVFGVRDQYGKQVFKRTFTGMGWEQQLDIVETHCRRYNYCPIDIDMTGIGDTLPEAARRRGLVANGIYWAGGGHMKEQMVSNLCVLMEQKAVTLLDDETQKEELKSYEYKINPKTRNVQYSAPQGLQDDHVSMLMMLYSDFNQASVILPYRGFLGGIKKKAI